MTQVFDDALAAISQIFVPAAELPPYGADYYFPISAGDLPAVKEALRTALPSLKPTHRLEILSRIAGHNSAAALHSRLKEFPFCACLSPHMSDAGATFVHRILTEHVQGAEAYRRSWIMAHHLFNIVTSWVTRSRFGRPHPTSDDELLEEARRFNGDVEGAMLFEHILETRSLDALIALPGKTMVHALKGPKDRTLEDVVKDLAQAFAFGVAVDATTDQGDFTLCNIEHASVTGEIIYEYDLEGSISLISEPTRQMAQILHEAGEKSPGLVCDDLGHSTIRDHGSLDARCFALAAQDGLPASLWAISTASLLLAVELGNMSVAVASRRLFGSDDISITSLLPNRDWSSAQPDWRQHIPGLARLAGISEPEAEATYSGLMDEWWETRPLLDFWLELLQGASGRPRRSAMANVELEL